MSSATPSSTAGHSQGSWWLHCSQAATSAAALLLALRTSRKQGLAQLVLLLLGLVGVGVSGCLLLLRWACLCGCLRCHPSLLCPGYQAQVILLESCSSWALPNAVEPGQGLCSVLLATVPPKPAAPRLLASGETARLQQELLSSLAKSSHARGCVHVSCLLSHPSLPCPGYQAQVNCMTAKAVPAQLDAVVV
jgi:hypothetical protein